MERLIVETVVYRPVEEVYEFLLDFPQYGRYSDYLKTVGELDAAADEQARYALRFAWWKLQYTARSVVTETVPNEQIGWRLLNDLDASGQWLVEGRDELPGEAPEWADTATAVRFEVQWNPHSVNSGALNLPRLVSLDWVIDKVKPVIDREAQRVVQRAVTDLEGRERAVEITVRTEQTDR
jgi:uncharacterized membrane protein